MVQTMSIYVVQSPYKNKGMNPFDILELKISFQRTNFYNSKLKVILPVKRIHNQLFKKNEQNKFFLTNCICYVCSLYKISKKGQLMSFDDSSRQIFLQELYNRAGGDFDVQVSMYDIGTDLGLAKEEVATLAQDLFIEELAEMKTLSGGMGITHKGLKTLGIKISSKNGVQSFRLGGDPVLDDQNQKEVLDLLGKIRAGLDGKALYFELMEEIVIDLKTIEVQMLSPHPKTLIIKETLKSINQNLKGIDPQDLEFDLQAIIS